MFPGARLEGVNSTSEAIDDINLIYKCNASSKHGLRIFFFKKHCHFLSAQRMDPSWVVLANGNHLNSPKGCLPAESGVCPSSDLS